jgi:hypothetical protein
MIHFTLLDPRYTPDALGFIPEFFSEADPRPAAEQLHDNYQHGGGWSPMRGWSVGPVGEIMWGSEAPLHPIAIATLHDSEIIRFYPHAWVSITQVDGSFEISRVD